MKKIACSMVILSICFGAMADSSTTTITTSPGSGITTTTTTQQSSEEEAVQKMEEAPTGELSSPSVTPTEDPTLIPNEPSFQSAPYEEQRMEDMEDEEEYVPGSRFNEIEEEEEY